ncbi:hypothetical protein ACQ4WX_07880 [Streptomyces lasalocidi]
MTMARTPPTTVTPVRLWRWRSNPLRRHSDVIEAWIILATWVFALLCGAVAEPRGGAQRRRGVLRPAGPRARGARRDHR